jgi:hypothetical protein
MNGSPRARRARTASVRWLVATFSGSRDENTWTND